MINENFAKRLLNARKQQGLSQDQLVARINGEVKKTAIAKYERGEMMPRHEIIEHLATALNQTIDYFYRPLTLEINKVQFRAKASLGARCLFQPKSIPVIHSKSIPFLINKKAVLL